MKKKIIVKVKKPPESGYYAVVHSSRLTGDVPGESDERFWGWGRHGSCTEYEQLIADSQTFIKKVMSGDVEADDDNYYIYGSDKIKPLLSGKHVDKMSGKAFKGSSWISKPITVHKIGKKYMYSGPDGRHRFAAARGIKNCYIIVFVEKTNNKNHQ